MVFDCVVWRGMAWDGVRWCSMVFDCVVWRRMVCDGVRLCGMAWYGVGWRSMVFDGVRLGYIVATDNYMLLPITTYCYR